MIGVRVEDPWERMLPHTFDNQLEHEQWVERRDAYWDQLFPSRVARLTLSTEDDLLDALIRFFKARMRAAH
jgi:hypothetical protein